MQVSVETSHGDSSVSVRILFTAITKEEFEELKKVIKNKWEISL